MSKLRPKDLVRRWVHLEATFSGGGGPGLSGGKYTVPLGAVLRRTFPSPVVYKPKKKKKK